MSSVVNVSGDKTRRRRPGCGGVIASILAVILIAALVLAIWRPALFGLGPTRISEDQIGASFKEIAELSVEEYAYSNVGTFDQRGFQVAGRTVPFTGRNFLVTYDGSVKAGLKDAEQVSVDIDDTARTLTVTLPQVDITANTIDPASISVYDQSMNPLNQVKVEDVAGFLAEQESRAADKAVQEGLLERAGARADELARSHAEALIEGTAMAGYAVEVKRG
ncbi:Protein of unknown function [Corynebacterium mycetoides]|uniref:DUF4230 domain-containing protein n=1 Tax=Corynebacterium mycetoides TaxID=38302 RepID=A0A1G9NFZ6_9CORY|nr:Protein of unknown function [Corynebacterium mycetoides]